MVTAAMRNGFAKAAAPGPARPRARQNELAAKRELLFENPTGNQDPAAKTAPASFPQRPLCSVRATADYGRDKPQALRRVPRIDSRRPDIGS
jgi:hypothetical protein